MAMVSLKRMDSLSQLIFLSLLLNFVIPSESFFSNAVKNIQMTLTNSHKKIYDIQGSGWTSPIWNWGSAIGTGHECAMICRDRYNNKGSRVALIGKLLSPFELKGSTADEIKSLTSSLIVKDDTNLRDPAFEEVKLILGLAWQNGRWDGSDGGVGGYGEVLNLMAQADRYEGGYEVDDCTRSNELFVQDMCSRFHMIAPDDQVQKMNSMIDETGNDTDACRRKCAGMVLKAMGFIEKGL